MKLFKKRKFKILKNDSIEYKGHTLYRIQALKDFGYINKGDIGGYVEYDFNLSQHGNCWIYNDAKVFGRFTLVFENAKVGGNAIVGDNCRICGNAEISDNAKIHGYSIISGHVLVFGNAYVYSSSIGHSARVFESARIMHNSNIGGDCWIHGKALVNNSIVTGNARIHDNAEVKHANILDFAEIYENAIIDAYDDKIAIISNNAKIHGKVRICSGSSIADNVEVSDGATIMDSNLFNDVKIYGNAAIINSTIFGNAKAFGHSILNHVYMYQNAEISGSDTKISNAKLCGNACIKSNNDFIIIENVIEYDDNIIFYRAKDKSIMANHGNETYTIEDYAVHMIEKLSDDKDKFNRLITTINYVRSILQ